MYQTALHQGEWLEFAPEDEDQKDFSRDKGREGVISSRDSGGDQLSEYNEDSFNSRTMYQWRRIVPLVMCKKKLSLLLAVHRTRSGWLKKTSNKAVLWAFENHKSLKFMSKMPCFS